jgi:hypothetical protein
MKKFKPTLVVSKSFAVPFSFRAKYLSASERSATVFWFLVSIAFIGAGILLQITAPHQAQLWLFVIGAVVFMGAVQSSQQFVEAAADRNLDLRERLVGENLATPRQYSLNELKEIAFEFAGVLENTNKMRNTKTLPLGYFGLREVLLQLIRREPNPEMVQAVVPVALVLSDYFPLTDEEELALSEYQALIKRPIFQTTHGAAPVSDDEKLAVAEEVKKAASIVSENESGRKKIQKEFEEMRLAVDEAFKSRQSP